jgi:hypothetical protein
MTGLRACFTQPADVSFWAQRVRDNENTNSKVIERINGAVFIGIVEVHQAVFVFRGSGWNGLLPNKTTSARSVGKELLLTPSCAWRSGFRKAYMPVW